jgi:nitroimidazol reductase NimA-like FMN-containing flavoprotein (pyridoxamine 5'-phosphate oxidase superfamily)
MDNALHDDIRAILAAGQDLTLATLREDGWPQATTVSYASDGLDVYFGCGVGSQKARNLARDDRVSLTVDLPYACWDEIRGLSLAGHAQRLSDPNDLAHVGQLFVAKFGPQVGEALTAEPGQVALFRIRPDVVSVLDYRKGFGHTDLVRIPA